MEHLAHLVLPSYVESGRQCLDDRAVATLGQVAEVVTLVVRLVPKPPQGLALGHVGGVGLDGRPQILSGATFIRAAEPGGAEEGLDGVGPCCAWLGGAPGLFDNSRELVENEVEMGCDLVGGQSPPFAEIERGHLGERVAGATADANAIGEVPHRVATRRVDPRGAEVHGDVIKIHGVETPTDSVAGLEDDVLDARMGQRVSHRQPRDARTDDQDAFIGHA